MVAPLPGELRSIVERIATRYAPDRVILFGSWAEGRAREDSDVDLLVVKDTDARPLDRVREARRALRGLSRSLGVDVLVLTPKELEDALARRNTLVTRAVHRGVVVYAR